MRHPTSASFYFNATLIFAIILLIVAQSLNERIGKAAPKEEAVIAFPIPLQLALVTGDRYLAANIGTLRAIVTGTHRLLPETYAVLAKAQEDAAFFNPANEDNYYIAQAILPWNGHAAETQKILLGATLSRINDDLPPFFFGFNKMNFEGDPIAGAKFLEIAAKRSRDNKDVLTNIAASWYARGRDPAMAMGFIRAMIERAENPGLKQHLKSRLVRLEGLQLLQKNVTIYYEKFGVMPDTLEDLVRKKLIERIPNDPWGKGYKLGRKGLVEFAGKET